jgi:hypothetical protein
MSAPRSNPSGRKRGAGAIMMDIDPNEPLYCFCQQVSYGDMVGCDNDSVSFFFFFETKKNTPSVFYLSLSARKEVRTKKKNALADTSTTFPFCFLQLDSATRSGSIMVVWA